MAEPGNLEKILKNPQNYSFDSIFDIPKKTKICIISKKNYLRCFQNIPQTYEWNLKFVGTLCERINLTSFSEKGYIWESNTYVLTNDENNSEKEILNNKLKYLSKTNQIVLNSLLMNPETLTYFKLNDVEEELDFCIISNREIKLRWSEQKFEVNVDNKFNFYGIIYKRNPKTRELEKIGYLMKSSAYHISEISNKFNRNKKIGVFS